ncbi:MAG TPA: preprotein translocase subunit SecE [Candidatus Absconditabacterales bacterium]|nr:preprotein translocase subunit SecE [Candidatus Absconditabacterales bacterium]
MLNFFYSSLETIKNVKIPTTSYFINMIIAIIVIVLISSVYFVGLDTIISQVVILFYNIMKAN